MTERREQYSQTKISRDYCPHRITGFAAGERRKADPGRTRAAITITVEKKGRSRIGDRLLLLTGHSSFKRSPGKESHTPWMVQLSLMTKPSAVIAMAAYRSAPAGRGRGWNGGRPSPRVAPAVNRNCQASGLKYQICPSG